MDIRGRRQSSNIEDRRGSRVRTGAGLSLGGVILLIVLSLLGINPLPFLGMATKAPETTTEAPDQPYQESAEETQLRQITAVVLADTEDTWNAILPKYGKQYVEPTLVLFTDAVESGCGAAQAAMGPFYCPKDQKVYVDLSFYHDLQRMGGAGDAAQAYVVAHEVGHHVQNLIGTAQEVSDRQQRVDQAQANQLSVRLELQADCFAGVWAGTAQQSRGLLDDGDIAEALTAAAAIGDDRLQRASQGRIAPESFTHGSSQQREAWLRRGMQAGTPEACDTFTPKNL
jgi:predicted metalloprotease